MNKLNNRITCIRSPLMESMKGGKRQHSGVRWQALECVASGWTGEEHELGTMRDDRNFVFIHPSSFIRHPCSSRRNFLAKRKRCQVVSDLSYGRALQIGEHHHKRLIRRVAHDESRTSGV